MNLRASPDSSLYAGRHIALTIVLMLIALPASTQEISGASTIGPRSSHIFTLRIPPDPAIPEDFGDTLPPGGDIFYQFAIFDTGSTTVGINNVATSDAMGNVFISTANLLDLCGPRRCRLRSAFRHAA